MNTLCYSTSGKLVGHGFKSDKLSLQRVKIPVYLLPLSFMLSGCITRCIIFVAFIFILVSTFKIWFTFGFYDWINQCVITSGCILQIWQKLQSFWVLQPLLILKLSKFVSEFLLHFVRLKLIEAICLYRL